jgi:hypothetical protein
MGRRSIDQKAAKSAIIAFRRAGASLVVASTAAGVHVATVCRWMKADPTFADGQRSAEREAARERFASRHRRNPYVAIHPCCPECGALAETRRGVYSFSFWRCRRWPRCLWSSWRPRCPADCPTCKCPMFWSFSRKSVSCPRCKSRHWVG